MDQMLGSRQEDIEDLPGIDCGVDVPFADNFYDFNAFQDRDCKSNGLDGSAPAQGLGLTSVGISVRQQDGRSATIAGEHHIVVPKQEPCDLPGVTAPHQNSSKHTIQAYSSPTFPVSSLHLNTSTGSNANYRLPPIPPPRPRSSLRNSYQFEHRNQLSPNRNNLQTTQPRRHFSDMSAQNPIFDLQPLIGQNPYDYRVHQQFDESNVRTPVNHTFPRLNSAYHMSQQHENHSPLPSIHDQLQYQNRDLNYLPMQRPIQPRTPPQAFAAETVQVSNQVSKLKVSTPSKIKNEKPSPRIATTTPAKRESTTVAHQEMTPTSSPDPPRDIGFPANSEEDRTCVDSLIAAMMDGTEAEDNEGMIKTWNKLSVGKEEMLEEKCIELLGLLKKGHHQIISDRKVVNRYESFDERFEAMCKTLRTQKTVCKHLLEPPYSHTVANDPTYAATRVINNRRVNDQKKHAINVGRKVMGQRGQGKGRKVSVIADDEVVDEDQFSDGLFQSDEDSALIDIKPEPQSEPRRRIRKAKKTHRRGEDNDDSDYKATGSASKKTRRSARTSKYVVRNVNGRNIMVDTTEDNNNEKQPMSSSPTQHNAVHYGVTGAYAPILPALQTYHQPHDQDGFSHNQAHQYDNYSRQQYNYSSGADPALSDDMNGNHAYSSEIDGYDQDSYGPVSYPGEYGNMPNGGY